MMQIPPAPPSHYASVCSGLVIELVLLGIVLEVAVVVLVVVVELVGEGYFTT